MGESFAMTTFVKCLVADGQDIFCIHGRLFSPDTKDECLRYMRPCTCATCTKAAKIRRKSKRSPSPLFRRG